MVWILYEEILRNILDYIIRSDDEKEGVSRGCLLS